MDGIFIQGTESSLSLALWPDPRTGIVLLATQFADLFFAGPSTEGGNMAAVIVKSPAPGKEEKGLRVITLMPVGGGFNRPEEKEAWGLFFSMMLSESDSIAGFQSFEGRIQKVAQDSGQMAEKEDAFIQLIFTQEGLLQMRDTKFKRNAEGVAIPTGPVQVEEGEGVSVEGRMVGRRQREGEE